VVSERRPPKDQPRPPQAPRTTEAPPELFGAIVTSEKAVPVAKPALPPSARQVAAPPARPPPPPARAPAPPPPPPAVEELDAADLEEIEDVEVIEAAIPSIVPVAMNPSLPPAPVSSHKDKDARIVLVVEDDASIRALIVRALGLSYTVYEADDGITAKHVLARIPAPACIISDWMMPRMDGLALLKSLRADPNMKWTPVVMLTAKNAPMEVLEGINSGARGYIAKPFKMKELLDKVATVIGKK
jgi:CheY-like chemotaxis protein